MIRAVSLVGLGRLGIPIAACLAAKGFQVTGADTDERKVEAIGRCQAPLFEPGLSELLRSASRQLKATGDVEAAVLASEATFIVVPTPSEPGGEFSLGCVLQACQGVGQALARKAGWHLVVLLSTVMPGSTGGAVREALEKASGRRCGQDFGLCYSPAFVALGSVINDFLHPDFVLIGESDQLAGDKLEEIYRSVIEKSPLFARMSFVNAELTKLAVNAFVTTKITFANMLARICERLPGAEVDVITSTLGMDSRVGGKCLKGAVGYGGPCFPRDNKALAALAHRIGAPPTLAEATDRFNQGEAERLANLVCEKLPPGGRVGVLGLSYKPDTDVVDEAQGLLLTRLLLEKGVAVVAYDPVALENARTLLKGPVLFADSVEACVRQADVVVVATPSSVFKVSQKTWQRPGSPRVVVDCWRILTELEKAIGVIYVPLGRGREERC